MHRKSYIESIENKLSFLVSSIELRSTQNLQDLNIYSENFFRDLLNLVYGYNLKNLNSIKANAKGIDLIDDTNNIIIQVSSTATTTKINNSINNITSEYQGYNLKFIIIVNKIPNLFSRTEPTYNKYISFDPKIDIIDISKILNKISDYETDKLREIYDFFNNEISSVERNASSLNNASSYKKNFSEALQYNINAYSKISILSVSKPVELQDIWIPLQATVIDHEENESLNLDATVERYQNWYQEKRHNETSIDSYTFGRFIKHCVVIGGAGIGKTTLFKKLALDYSNDRYFVLFIKLSKLKNMLLNSDEGFEECLVNCAFDGKIQTNNVSSLLKDAVILADGLDECFEHQTQIIQGFSKLSKDYPDSRILISTRPVGHKLDLISAWRRYELNPIEDSKLEDAVKKLTSVISPEESIDEAVLEQINSNKISNLVRRNPLILSLVVELVKRGIEANTNYASLYKQLFKSIENESRNRSISAELSEEILKEFLYLLGWVILKNGYKPIEEVIELCCEEWVDELQLSKLNAKVAIGECIEYWIAKGIIEKVNDLTDETVLFIHKTLGEYAAAEYLKRQSVEVQEEFIIDAFSNAQYSETLTFLSYLGLSSKILSLWTEKHSQNHSFEDTDIYDFILNAGIDYSSREIESFISLCWEITEDTFSTNRYTSGAIICHIAENAWVKVKSTVEKRLKSKDDWVRLVAFTALTMSNDNIETSKLLNALEWFQIDNQVIEKRPKKIILKSLLSFDGQSEVKNLLILAIVNTVLFRENDKDIANLEDALLKIKSDLSIGVLKKIQQAYRLNNLAVPNELSIFPHKIINRISPHLKSMSELIEVFKEDAQRGVSFLEMLQDETIQSSREDSHSSDIELAALISISNLWNCPAYEGYLFIDEVDEDTLRTLLKSLSEYGGINYHKVTYHVNELLERIKSEEDNSTTEILLNLPKVDIEGKSSYKVNNSHLPMLERLLLSQYHFLCFNAVMLIATSADENKIIEIFERVIDQGEGVALYYAAHLNQCISNKKLVQNVICNKLLNKEIVNGFEHLYQFVDESYDNNHISIVERGLNSSSPTIATEAANLLDRLPYDLISSEMVKKFYSEWLIKEEPYPIGGGTVPNTPRDELAKIIIKNNFYDGKFIQQMILDDRPAIKKQATAPLIEYCKSSAHLRNWFIDKITSYEIAPEILKEFIVEDVFLDDARLIVELLDNEDDNIRESALEILNTKYISNDEIKSVATRLLNDELIEIRQFAKRVLESY